MARGPLRVTRAGRIPAVRRPGPDTLDFLFRNVGVSKRRVMEEIAPMALEFEPRLLPAVKRWLDLTPWQRRFVTLDDLAQVAGLTRGEFVAAIARASFEFTGSINRLILASALPEMVAASVQRALTPEGHEVLSIRSLRTSCRSSGGTFRPVAGQSPNTSIAASAAPRIGGRPSTS